MCLHVCMLCLCVYIYIFIYLFKIVIPRRAETCYDSNLHVLNIFYFRLNESYACNTLSPKVHKMVF